MKIRAKLSPLLLAFGLALGVMSITTGTAHAQATVSGEAVEGSIELGNTSGTGDQPAAAPEAAAADADTTADADAKPPKDPREAYRDLVIQQSSQDSSATSAVSRRYKKVDKATYNELLQSGALQPAQPAQ
jgi:hypothetical protein